MRTARPLALLIALVLAACGAPADLDARESPNPTAEPSALRKLRLRIPKPRRLVADAGVQTAPADPTTTDAGNESPPPAADAGPGDPLPVDPADPSPPPADPPPPDGVVPAGWLYTSGNKILVSDGQGGGAPFLGRGANVHDTRSCWACAYEAPNVGEVKRRIDLLVDGWGANFVRLNLESYTDDASQTYGRSIGADPSYLADVEEIVAHVGQKPGVYVLLSLWHDPSVDEMGWPTAATAQRWAVLAERFKDAPHVMFGIVNEPTMNYDGALDQAVWNGMNQSLQAIREVEQQHGTPPHVVVAQGTGGWSRFVGYYVDHPLPGENVAYEVHFYNSIGDFGALVGGPAQSLPVIIGEFGPVAGAMTQADSDQMITAAMQRDIPFLAWTFHMRCPPNLLADNSGGACGVGMDLQPSAWGQAFKARLAEPW